MLARIRETVPGVAVSSDFIVGFCGETEASFEKTVGLVERARFKNSFIFKYSPRPAPRPTSCFTDDVPEEVKKRRNNDLLAVQNGDQPGGQSRAHRPRRSRCWSKGRASPRPARKARRAASSS